MDSQLQLLSIDLPPPTVMCLKGGLDTFMSCLAQQKSH